MRFLLLIIACAIAMELPAQENKILSVEQARADLDGLQEGLETYNPAMYAYHPKAAYQQQINYLKGSITAPIATLDFYKYLCAAVAEANEAHITIGGTSDVFYTGFLDGTYKSLPLSVKAIGQRIFVWFNLSNDNTLERGDEILSINNRSIDEIRREIFKYTVSDGAIETFKTHRFGKEFSARYFWFIERPNSFVIEYKKRGSEEIKSVKLDALTRTEMSTWSIKRNYKSERVKGINKVYSLSIKDQVAYWKLRSFDEVVLAENDLEAAPFYERIFKRIKQNKVQHLIIDVRDNKGGKKEFGDAMLPFVLRQKRQGHYRELIAWNGKVTNAYFPKLNKWRFKGKIYILVNGSTFSTASHIAKYLKEFADAIIIGEETGSRYEGFAAGNYHEVTLPNSKIKIRVPNKWVKNIISDQQQTTNRGVLPDYDVQPTIDDWINQKDPVLEKAMRLIK